ncbi:chaperone NapD [Niveibacterium sp. SC-1]|uniref:chaperone NapD n=1 Tax=Niveibacterium sp. SC-1 TaxID=3135646 RepID=UPI00311E6A35
MSEELHITSLVVYADPGRAASVADFIAHLPGAQVHGRDASGKLVVTLETSSSGAMIDQVSQIQRIEGVLNAALVYQHADTLEAMNGELDHDRHTP